jgi:hypothetical protein
MKINKNLATILVTVVAILSGACGRTSTPIPPTATLVPPTETPVPPTATMQPATITPTLTPASTLPPVRISVFCGLFHISPQTAAVDQPVVLFWNWQATTDAYRQDYINAASFTLSLDGANLDISKAGLTQTNDTKGYYAVWHMPATLLPAGNHTVVLTEDLAKQITDGSDANKDNILDAFGPGMTNYPPCTIIVK